jgi:uncharacterized RDD family membrane protein YckC
MAADQSVIQDNAPQAASPIAGFWRRTAAFLIDGVVLAVPGLIFGTFFYDRAASLGPMGRAVGFAAFMVYFTLMDSRFGHGQSAGKRAMAIRVVSRNGKTISVARAAARTLIVAVPYFVNGAWFGGDWTQADFATKYLLIPALSFTIFGLGGTLVYLYVFNKTTRQSLQDLAVGTFVVRDFPGTARIAKSIRKYHLVIAGCWCLLSLVALPLAALTVTKIIPAETLAALTDIRTALLSSPEIRDAQVIFGTTAMTGTAGSSSNTFLQVSAKLRTRPASLEGAATSIAETVLSLHPDLLGRDLLAINVGYGYDLGIAAWTQTYNESKRPAEWMAKIKARSAESPAQAL